MLKSSKNIYPKGFFIKTYFQHTTFMLLFIFIGCREVPIDENNNTQNTSSIKINTQEVQEEQVNKPISLTKTEIKAYKIQFINEDSCNQIIDNEFIIICYDYKIKGAKSVAYTLEGDLVNQTNIDQRPSFYVEKSIDKKYRITNTDYIYSGYDRGHLAPDAGFDWSEESLKAVYTFANIIPQAPQTNQTMWFKVEKYARDKAVELGEVDVINIVKYNPKRSRRMGKNKMAISKGYYKVLYNANEEYEECFYYDNKLGVSSLDDTPTKHLVECDSVSY